MSNVLEFRQRPKPETLEVPTHIIEAVIELDADGYMIRVLLNGTTPEPLPAVASSRNALSGRALWQAAWVCFRDHMRENPEDQEAVTLIAAISRGSRVTVYSPDDEDSDAYVGEKRLAWLKRRLNEIHDLAQPSWLEEQPASGMTSPSHSAIFDQLEFSW